jgi:predicted small lipoprotein YifL
MKRLCKPFLAILTGLLVCGCGQKGALFLPGDRSQVHTELPEMDREALEEALEDDDEEDAPAVPRRERSQADDDEAEPFVDPASPPSETEDR